MIALKLGTMGKSGSLGLPGGKGYSKRGETSNGVPTMEDGECSERLVRLSRGFSAMGCVATFSAREST